MAYLNTAAAYAAILAAKDTGNPADKVTWAELSNILRSISDDIDSLRTIETNYVSTALSYSNPTWLTGLAWSKISGTPTSLSGYGITDAVDFNAIYVNPAFVGSLAWSKITGTPTSLAGYGITDAVATAGAQTVAGIKTFSDIVNASAGVGTTGATDFRLFANNAQVARFFQSTGNFVIGSATTDGGFRLDVSGTARFAGVATGVGYDVVLPTLIANTKYLSIRNTAGTSEVFYVDGSGRVGINNVVVNLNAQGNGTISGSSGVGNANTFLRIQGAVNYSATSGTASTLAVGGTSSTTSGNMTFNALTINPTINNTGTYSGVFRGVLYNPTLTSLTGTTHVAWQNVVGDALFGTTSGSVGIGANTSINASAILDITSTTKGVLIPRMTTAQRTAIASPATGLILYDTDLGHICYYDGSSWRKISHSAA